MTLKRPVAVVTGASGGMGRACARQLGRRYDLVLNDVEGSRLETFAEGLRDDGYSVAAALAADLSAPGAADALVAAARAAGPIRAVVHTAGLSPAQADWQTILRTNLIGTERLLVALEADLEPGLAAVLIASMAAHRPPHDAALDGILAEPLAQSVFERAEPLIRAIADSDDALVVGSVAYAQSKRAVVRICERRAPGWGRKGARIVSISPGMIWTPMGRLAAETSPHVQDLVENTPVGRWGTAADIADAADFLVSDLAGYISGCDLRVDGGIWPATAGVTF